MNKKSRKLLTWCLVLSMLLTQVLFTNVALAATRYEGADRYQTALAAVKAGWTSAETVVIAQGEELADALAAAPLAYAKGKAPIILTKPNELPAGLLDELTALGTKTVYIVGGTGAVSADVEAALAAKLGAANVIRVAGADRVATALAVANAAFPTAPEAVVLAGAYAYADALSVSSIAAAKGMPILLVDGTMTADVAAYVAGKTVYAVGGTGVLADAALPAGATRLAGADRYATNAAILGEFELDFSKIYLAKGEDANMVDALAGSALAALTNSPIVLVDYNNTVNAAKSLLSANIADETEVIALGGAAVVPNTVVDAVEGLKPSANEPEELEVESVTADNLKQIVVTFNKAITDEDLIDAVEDEGNYKIEDNDNHKINDAIDTVELDDSGKVATITLNDDNSDEDDVKALLENQEDYTLVIGKEILGSDTEVEFTPKDTELPEALSAEVVGIDTIKVTFSEPMKPDTVKQDKDGVYVGYLDRKAFSVNDGKYNVKEVELVKNNTEANVVLYSDLKDGEELTVKVKSTSVDYAGYSVVSNTFTTTVVEDTEAPEVVGFKDADRQKVTLLFNEDIKAKGTIKIGTDSDPDIYHTNKHNFASTCKISGNEMKLTFGDDEKLPAGTAYIYIVEDTVQDLWENANDDITAKVEIVADNTRPTVKKVEQGDSEKEIVVYFSEEMDEETATDKTNYTVKNSDGDKESIRKVTLNSDGDEATITMVNDLDTDEEYTVTVEDVEDLSGNVVEDYEGKVAIADKTAVDISTTEGAIKVNLYEAGTPDQRIIVDFGEKMATGDDKYAIDDISNYLIEIDGRVYEVEDLYDAEVTAISGNKKAQIDLPYYQKYNNQDDKSFALDANDKLQIGRVADDDGNIATNLASAWFKLNSNNASIAFDTAPRATAKDEITFTFDDEVDFDPDEDTVTVFYGNGLTLETIGSAQKLDVASYDVDVNDDGNTVVTLGLDKDLSTDGKYENQEVYVFLNINDDMTNDDGATLDPSIALKKVDDKIAPEVATVDVDDDDDIDTISKKTTFDIVRLAHLDTTLGETLTDKYTADITIEMSEDIDSDTVSKNTFETENDDYKVESISVNNNIITIRLSSDEKLDIFAGYEITQKYGFEDMKGNEVTGIDTQVNFDDAGIDEGDLL